MNKNERIKQYILEIPDNLDECLDNIDKRNINILEKNKDNECDFISLLNDIIYFKSIYSSVRARQNNNIKKNSILFFNSVKEKYYSCKLTDFEDLIIREMLDLTNVYMYFDKVDMCDKKTTLTENQYKNIIIKNWDKIKQFKDYKYISTEYKVETGRVDILGLCLLTNRPIIIELKINNKRYDRQLLDYSRFFNNPILIGISENKARNQFGNIISYTYKELLKEISI